MRFDQSLRIVLAAVAFTAGLYTAAVAQQAIEKVSPQYIPADAYAAVVAHPHAALERKEMELMPREIMAAAGEKELGFDPTQIRRFIAFVGIGESLRDEPKVGMILRFAERPKLSEQLIRGTTKEELQGRPYYKADREEMLSFFMPDANTLLIAPDSVMQQMVKAEKVDTPLVELLTNSPPSETATAYVAVEQIKDQLKDVTADVPLPRPLIPLLTIPDELKSLRVDVGMDKLALNGRITMIAYDDESAASLEKTIDDSVQFGSRLAIAQFSQDLGPSDPIQKATLAYINRMSEAFKEMLKPKRDGAELVLDLDGQVATPGVLVALLLPAVNAAREAARRNMAMNNLKQIALAMHIHHEAKRTFPAAASQDKDGKPLLSWRVHILPYIEEENLYKQFHLDEPWDSEHNRTLIDKMPAIYRNPNSDSTSQTNFLAVTGEGFIFDGKEGLGMAHIRDGASNTIMFVEADLDQSVVWTKPADLLVDPRDPLKGLAGFRAGGGFLAAFADGHVQYISGLIDKDDLKALFTRDGGEIVRDF